MHHLEADVKYLEEAAGSGMYSLFELADKLLPEVLASSHTAVLDVRMPSVQPVLLHSSSTNSISTGKELLAERLIPPPAAAATACTLPLLEPAAAHIAEHTACCTVVREICGAVIVGRRSFQPYAECAGNNPACKGCKNLLPAVLSRRRSSGDVPCRLFSSVGSSERVLWNCTGWT